ncbi:putative ATP-binding protein involved in virulence [Thiovulum sp. ES]|nr:putative ATP-binding protein involved in virulence [Thiovulum sp. ES]
MKNFITDLTIKNVRGIQNLHIPLSKTDKKHLLITGKNGSGKTTTLIELNNSLNGLISGSFAQFIENKQKHILKFQKQIKDYKKQKENLTDPMQLKNIEKWISDLQNNILYSKRAIENWQEQVEEFSNLDLNFNQTEVYNEISNGSFILAFFQAQRMNKPTVPKSIENVNLPKKNQTATTLHMQFIKFLVRLRNTMLNEQFDGDKNRAKKIKEWFDSFENTLKDMFGHKDLKLKYFNDTLNFKINYEDKEFALNELSDGYSSLLAIVTEIILRMEAHGVKAYDMEGIILIDEIETHLHIELQKKVFPFLTKLFPNIQFIVTTHSPFVLHSMPDSVICDLERREITSGDRFKNSSYSHIVKNYFEVDSEFSQILLNDIEKFENLVNQFENGEVSEEAEEELLEMDIKLNKISPMLSDEVYLRFKNAQEKILDK